MEWNTIQQVYLLPAQSQILNAAAAVLDALGLKHEEPRELNRDGQALLHVAVTMPVFSIVHHLDLTEVRHELATKAQQHAARPSHPMAKSMVYGAVAGAYSDEFFSHSKQLELTYVVADFVVREHIVSQFSPQGIIIHKITLNKSASQVLSAPRYDRDDTWYALVEEARPMVANLGAILGAL